MKSEAFNHEFNKMLKWFANDSAPGILKFELEFYKKLWNYFLLGDSYYFILNHNSLACDIVSQEVENILGYHPSEFNMQFLNDRIHPEDHPWFLTFGARTIEFFSQLPQDKLMKYKVRHDMRFRKKNGDYARMLYQGVMIEHDESGRILRTLGVHTDISHLKQEGRPVLSFIGMDGEPSYLDVGARNIFIESKEELTGREKQVLTLLIKGKVSKEIGSILHISKQTVDTHRRNMLRKNNLSNTIELIGKAIRCGWI